MYSELSMQSILHAPPYFQLGLGSEKVVHVP